MKKIFAILITVFLVGQVFVSNAQSYIYLQGDKQTPFYVKINGRMMPRYGKNYCIVPNLQGETVNLEILFQTNTYPTQNFKVRVPKDGGRGFLLVKQNDKAFSLYDLQSNGYVPNGNIEDEAFVALERRAAAIIMDKSETEAGISKPSEKLPEFVPEKSAEIAVVQDPSTTGEESPFLENVDLAKPKPSKREQRIAERAAQRASNQLLSDGEVNVRDVAPTEQLAAAAVAIPNSDCKEPLATTEFEDLASKVLDMSEDGDRLKYIGKIANRRNCFSTEQVRILGKLFKSQSGRLLLFKELYPKVTDQSNYKSLETLLSTTYLREEFLKSL